MRVQIAKDGADVQQRFSDFVHGPTVGPNKITYRRNRLVPVRTIADNLGAGKLKKYNIQSQLLLLQSQDKRTRDQSEFYDDGASVAYGSELEPPMVAADKN